MKHPIIPIQVQPQTPATNQGASRERKRQGPKGRRVDAFALEQIKELLGDASRQSDLLIEHLHKIQDAYGHLSSAHLAALAQEMKLAQAAVYEVASFYHHFDIVKEAQPAPANSATITLRVCDGLSCEMAGAQDLLTRLPGLLQQANQADVRVIAAPCIGRCEQAPAVSLGQNAFGHATCSNIIEQVKAGAVKAQTPVYLSYADYRANGGYALLQECVDGVHEVDDLLQILQDSGLRGLGGAGFPAARKWRIVRAEAAPRLMAVNLDEGEPGTFKDRVYLEQDPHRFLEGMLIAGWAVGVAEIYLYIRDEYHACRLMLEAELAHLKANPPVQNCPVIHLRRGAGAYICGEESAMIESIEGKRGMPRLRPPFVAQTGVFGRPTLVHNFETLYRIREIFESGLNQAAARALAGNPPGIEHAYTAPVAGRHGRTGMRSFSVSGRVKLPGVKRAPAGITIAELIEEYCGGMLDGHTFYGYLPGGASGGILPASLNQIPLDFDTLQEYGCFIGSAAVVVLSDQDSAVAAARNAMNFFKHESCGQCTPCRVGTEKAAQLINREKWDLVLLAELSQLMRDASICGLGQAAPNPVDCVIKYFPHELA